jgi:TPP-dependent pyruvate/acetoin dehydrogenase alpha subunit
MMAAHFSLFSRNLSSSSVVATQIPHAVGAALASKLRGTGAIALAIFGDGATSPRQMAVHSNAQHAAAYGKPGVSALMARTLSLCTTRSA